MFKIANSLDKPAAICKYSMLLAYKQVQMESADFISYTDFKYLNMVNMTWQLKALLN